MTKQIPQGYKQTKVGIIPEDWDVVKIGDVCDCIVPGRNKPVDFNGNIPWVTTPDITTKYICDTKSNLYITIEEAKKIGSKVVPKNSVIMSCVGELGLLSIVKKEIVINQQLHAFIPSSQVNTEFLHYVLGTQKKYMDSVATKTAVPYMNKDNCNSIPIPLPKVKEQEKIAEILSTWDDAITKQGQLIEQKQVLKKGIMQQIFTQKIRFKDDNGNDYPDWEEKHLDEICTFFSGGTPTSSNKDYYTGDIPFIGSGNISNNQVEQFITNEALKSSSAKMIEKGDLLLALYGATSGQSAIAKLSGAINQAILCIRTQELKEFIFYWLQLNKDNILSTYLQGGQGNLSAQIIKQLKLELPTLSEQIKIADFLINVDDEITKQTEVLDQLKLQKQSLMQKLLTGQVRAFNYSKESA